jgi:lipoate-protein ligase A
VETWFHLADPPQPPALNMACDEWLLYNIGRFGKPVLRVYAWDRPAVSIGYFQSSGGRDPGKAVIRRPTGGGAVDHSQDITYSVVVGPGHPWYSLCACDRYKAVHQLVRNLFLIRSLPAEYATSSAQAARAGGDCYDNPVAYDLMLDGQKVGGGAQRKTKSGLLHQGTVKSIGNPWGASEWARAFGLGGIRLEPLALGPDIKEEIGVLAHGKYSQRAWNELR